MGLSGGADSAALFHMLANSGLDLAIMAVHVNHGLRGEDSERDEAFSAALAQGYGADFHVHRADVARLAKKRKLTEEEAGREFRYESFHRAAEDFGAAKIALAHNMDDNAETMIMRFFRGTGLRGLAGIPPRRAGFIPIIRPLLNISRAEIEAYLASHGLDFCRDATNDDNKYTRNKIRNVLLPLAMEFNPSVVKNLAAASRLCAAEDAFLDGLAKSALEESVIKRDNNTLSLSLPKLLAAEPVILNRLIRMAYGEICGHMKDLGQLHVELAAAMTAARRGKRIDLPGGVVVARGHEAMVFEKNAEAPVFSDFCYPTDLSEGFYIAERDVFVGFGADETKDLKKLYTIGVGCDRIGGRFALRTRLPGDRMAVPGVGRRKLKDFLCERKFSKRQKDALFYLADGSDILAVLSGEGAVWVPVSGDLVVTLFGGDFNG